ncbi:hypothetical protein AMS68_003262 [Peltaster fructicola]|uniref:Protein phosphatase 4 core regulatory subunit R2 n=1 Tax=Peltaster fructicola TaxID=286661 RepID=A0A6H0XSW9_9PEZI|nr:hypothetical protein AMS68_003262 [Peltaster fructicola]
MTYEKSLEEAAKDGSLDIADWPRLLEELLQRLHNIVYNDFPIPQLPPPASLLPSQQSELVTSTPPQPSILSTHADTDITDLPPASQQSTKENDVPAVAEDASVLDSSLPTTLPPDLLSSYQSSVRILERDFPQSPPYTVQRLAELVLQPRKHYRYLPAYLRALDRVVSVSSPVSDFPLPTGLANINGSFLTHGDPSDINGIQEREGLGSDESLGGALLTPIPWLRNSGALASQGEGEFHSERLETIIGPNGAGSIETVSVTINGVPSASSAAHTSPNTSTPASPTLSEQSDASTNSSGSFSISTEAQLREQGGVTQGELLRQEQEAGVIPVAQAISGRRMHLSTDYAAASREPAPMTTDPTDEQEEVPHALGPDVIGMEDTGHVQSTSGLDMEAAVGRSRSKSPQPPAAEQEDEQAKDRDGDVIVAD